MIFENKVLLRPKRDNQVRSEKTAKEECGLYLLTWYY
jgi:hypothetical protein